MNVPNFYPLGVFSSSGTSKTTDTNTVAGQRNAYTFCPAVTAVVNMKVAMAMNGRSYFSDNKGGELKTTTIKSIEAQGTQFKTFYKTMVQVFGKSYVYVRRLPGIKEPEYHVIPNWELTENKATSDFWGSNIKFYTWSHNGMSITIQPEEIFIINDTGFDFLGSYKNGGSRLISLGDAVQNIIAAYEARNMLLTNGGPPVIVSPEKSAVGADIMMPGDKAELEQKLVDRYGFQRGKKLLAIATIPLRALKVGLTAGDLAAFEEVNNDWKEICTGYGLSPYLFGIADTTFTNFSEAQKSAYQNTIIPEQSNENEQITRYFGLNNPLMSDFSHVECLQDNENKAADALKKNVDVYGKLYSDGVITYNTYLKYIGETEITGGDKYVSDMTTQPLAVRIGVGGTQSLQAILADPNLTDNQKIGILIVLFGITEQEANQMLKR